MPYSEFPEFVFDFQIIIQVAKNSKRPTIPPTCPPQFAEVIKKCWSQAQNDRPTIPEVLQALLVCRDEHFKKNPEEWNKTAFVKDK